MGKDELVDVKLLQAVQSMSSDKTSNLSNQERIATRNNWLKILVVAVFTVVIAYKLWQADFSQALANFDFSDLLALFLALFSIGLSVLFYLKATDTSNVFYDNTYRFTRDVSEILGRVEAGFGEKLAHLDEGYSGLKSAVEKIPFDRQQAEKDIEDEELEVQRVERERAELIESLAERARLEGEEKQTLFERLEKQDEELLSARRELHLLRRRLANEDASDVHESFWQVLPDKSSRSNRPHSSFLRYLANWVNKNLSARLVAEGPMSELNTRFKEVLQESGSEIFKQDLFRYGIVDEDGDLTRQGRSLLRRYSRSENLS